MLTTGFYRLFFTFLILPLAHNLHAGYEEQISVYRKHLLSNPLEKISEQTITLELVPQFTTFDEVKKELYSDVKAAGDGQDSRVYSAKSLIDRPDVGLKQGQALAIRAARIDTNQEKSAAIATLMNFARLERLRDQEKPITDFFPAFYGAYSAVGDTKYFGKKNLSHQEMEMADATFAQEHNCGRDHNYRNEKKVVSDCSVLEFCLGEWAGAYFSGVGSQDAKPDNWAVKIVNHSRTYIVEGKEFKIPASEKMPMRIDVGGAGRFTRSSLTSDLKYSYSCSLKKYTGTYGGSESCRISKQAEMFLKDLDTKRETSIFKVFEDFYKNSQCSVKASTEDSVNNKIFVWPTIE